MYWEGGRWGAGPADDMRRASSCRAPRSTPIPTPSNSSPSRRYRARICSPGCRPHMAAQRALTPGTRAGAGGAGVHPDGGRRQGGDAEPVGDLLGQPAVVHLCAPRRQGHLGGGRQGALAGPAPPRAGLSCAAERRAARGLGSRSVPSVEKAAARGGAWASRRRRRRRRRRRLARRGVLRELKGSGCWREAARAASSGVTVKSAAAACGRGGLRAVHRPGGPGRSKRTQRAPRRAGGHGQ